MRSPFSVVAVTSLGITVYPHLTPVKPAVEKDNNKTNDNTNKKVDTADKKTTKTEAPKTGDTANIAMNVFVMAICGAAIVTVIFRKRFTRR